MPLSKKEINRQRELMNYEYAHLYNVVKYRTYPNLAPIERAIKEERAGADPAEYGVKAFVNGKEKLWKFSSYKRAVEESQSRNGTIVRLGRNTMKASDVRSAPIKALVDESGNIEPFEEEIEGDEDYNVVIALALTEAGAIQYKGTRPGAKILLELHKRHPDITFEDFAAAVIKHCETPPYREGGGENHQPSRFILDEEKEAWYSTPAGQQWLKDNPIPDIMKP